jgi:hypothetical protein
MPQLAGLFLFRKWLICAFIVCGKYVIKEYAQTFQQHWWKNSNFLEDTGSLNEIYKQDAEGSSGNVRSPRP